jgi:hypothetical protein
LTCLQYTTLVISSLAAVISLLSLFVSVAMLVLRWQDRRTDFKVEATQDESHGTLVLTVINRGQGEATVSRLFLVVYQGGSTVGERELTRSLFTGGFDLPKRLPPGDRAEFSTELALLRLQMKQHNYTAGWYQLESVAEDGRRKQYKGDKVWFRI